MACVRTRIMSPDAHASLMATKPGRPPLHGQCGNFGCALPVKTFRETPRCVHPHGVSAYKIQKYTHPLYTMGHPRRRSSLNKCLVRTRSALQHGRGFCFLTGGVLITVRGP